ncbi:MAG: carboxypeptidase-like regulatory domain-containing protein, partial [Prevotella sp.]
MKKLLLLAIMVLTTVTAMAQSREISGTITDKQSKDAVSLVTIQLLKKDSTFVMGTTSGDDGKFAVKAPSDGQFILKISSIGYKTITRPITIKDDADVKLGTILFSADAIMLKEATVTAQAQKVILKEDTFVYNAAAYRTPEGSTIEELVKRLPGAQVSDDGKITINGKEVKKILIDGKEFMTGDTKTAMKNIPTSIINKVKAYDQKSDLARVTGIDDGDEQTVLDFGIKPGMNKGFMANVDVGVGTKDRYSSRAFGGYMKNDLKIFGMGNANNVNDMGFGGRGGGFGRGRNGLNATKMAGVNVNYEKKDKIKVDGSARWNHSDGDVQSKTSSENYVSTVGSFSNSVNRSFSRSNSFDARARVEWTPDSMTNIMFRPTMTLNTSDGLSSSSSASFNSDPYAFVTDPLAQQALRQLAADSAIVNSNISNGISYSKSNSFGAMLQLNRKLNSRGRNVTVRGDVSYTDSKSNSLSTNNVHLYQIQNALGQDSTYQTNRYNLAPSTRWNYTLQATYSEPLWKATFLQLRYRFQYSYSKSDRSTYDFSNLGENFFSTVSPAYRSWDNYLNLVEQPWTKYLDTDLSRYSSYKNYTHNIELMFRMLRT